MEFIDGITVLTEHTYGGITWWQALIVAVILGLIIGLFVKVRDDNWATGLFAGILVLIVAYGSIYIGFRKQYTNYEVLIDDSVSMRDFDVLYTLVGQDGEIFTIRVKEQN